MIIRLILIVVVIALLFWLYGHLSRLPKPQRNQLLIKIGIWALIVISVVSVFTGRMHWVGAAIAGLIGLAKFGFGTLVRFLPFLNFLRRNKIFGNPIFRTPYLEVRLDINSGEIKGSILDGLHEGKSITQLSSSELEELERYYEDKDKRSYYLIRVIRQRAGAHFESSSSQSQANYRSAGDPSLEEALQILGLDENPSKDEIVQAHRRLMQKLHPDRGGNDYLASRVNLAKDVLLNHFGQ